MTTNAKPQPAPSYTQLIPVGELSQGQAAKIRNQLIRHVVQEASKRTNLIPEKIVVRDIRPASDLAFTSEDWSGVTGATAGAYETMITGTMEDQRWLVLFGVRLATLKDEGPAATLVRFTVGGAERAIWSLAELNPEDGNVGFSPSGLIIPQNTPYNIERWVVLANSSFPLVLKGVVVEPRGKVISP